MKRLLICFLMCTIATAFGEKTHYFNGTDFKGGYVVIPEDLPTDGTKTWVVAHIHGAGGLRHEKYGHQLKEVLAPEKVIFLVPSFTSGYQSGDGEWAAQMEKHFKWVQDNYTVHDKMFVHGHSGGGQFAHRYGMMHSKYVVGVSAHSSGSWACNGGYGTISAKAKGIPFVISCGEKDTGLSVASYEYGRLAWFKLFQKEIEKKGFTHAHTIWPGAGHGVPMHLQGPMLRECFLLATQGIVPTSDWWVGDLEAIAEAAKKEYGGLSPAMDAVTLSYSDRKAVDAANGMIKSGKAPDTAATIRFLAKYPASKWVGEEEYAPLRKHCQASAAAYLAERKASGEALSTTAMKQFEKATQGLDLEMP